MFKWVVRLAIVTGICGFAGLLIILYEQVSEGKKTTVKVNQPSTITPKLTDSASTALHISAVTPAKEEPVDTLPKVTTAPTITQAVVPPPFKDTIKKEIPVKKIETNVDKVVEKKETANEKKARKVPKSEDKLLNSAELQRLLRKMKSAKGKSGKAVNCVQLTMTTAGNNKRLLRQIETFLRNHSFAIAGREIIESESRGIKFSSAGPCLKLIIGPFH